MAKKEDVALRASRGRSDKALGYRLKRLRSETMKPTSPPVDQSAEQQDRSVSLELGWGRLLFAQTFETNEELAGACGTRARPGATSPFISATRMCFCPWRRRNSFLTRRTPTGSILRPIARAGVSHAAFLSGG